MQIARRTVNPDMLVLARESRGFTQSQLAREIDITQGALSKIENGMLVMSDEVLGKTARVLEYPQEFFLLREERYGAGISFIYHRSRKALPQKVAERIEAQVNIHRIVISRMVSSVEIDRNLPFFDIDEAGGDAEGIAKAIRAAWLLPRGPVKNLTEVIEKAGGIIVKCDFGTSKIDALSQSVDGLPPLFFINKNIPGDRLRFSLAHELGHIVMHNLPRPEMEKEADGFAAELLMPAEDISGSLQNVSVQLLASLKPYWRVSMAALLHRASDLRKISSKKYSAMWMQMGKAGYRLREPAGFDIPVEEPRLLKKLVDIYLNELKYSLAELGKLVALHPNEFRENYLGDERHLKLVRIN